MKYDFEHMFIGPEAQRKASAYFERVRSGQSEVYETPFFNGQDRLQVVENWFDGANSWFKQSVPGLSDFEKSMLRKVGPLSVMKPLVERIDDIDSYFSAVKVKSTPIDPKAVRAFISTLKGIKVPLRDARSTADKMRLSTNSGVPFFARRRSVLEETLQLINSGAQNLCDVAILGWRGQEGGPEVDDIKQRVVWMFPFGRNITELQFYQPAIEKWQANSINSAYISMEAVEEKITKLFDTKGNNYVIVTDFSKFDQHFNEDLQNAALEVIKSMSTDMTGSVGLRRYFQ